MYSMVAIVNNAVFYIWKVLREWNLKVLITRKKLCNCVVMDVNQSYCGNHLTIHTHIRTLCCAPETHILLCVNWKIKELNIKVIKILTKFRRTVDEQKWEFQQRGRKYKKIPNWSPRAEEYNIWTEKHSRGLNSTLDKTEGRASELEGGTVELIQLKRQKEKSTKEWG